MNKKKTDDLQTLVWLAGTLRPIPTEPLCIPDLCLAGRLPQQHNAVFNLDLSAANAVPGAAADVTAWPEFHNGVAAGECAQSQSACWSRQAS